MALRWPRRKEKHTEPKPAIEWKTKEVQRFLRELDLPECATAAKKAKLVGRQLLEADLSPAQELAQLYTVLGLSSILQKKKLRTALTQLRQQQTLREALSASAPLPTSSPSSPIASPKHGSSSSNYATPNESTESSAFFSPMASPTATPTRLRSLSDETDPRSPLLLEKRQKAAAARGSRRYTCSAMSGLSEVNNLSEAQAFLGGGAQLAVKAVLRRRCSRSVVDAHAAEQQQRSADLESTQRVPTRAGAFEEVDVSLLRLHIDPRPRFVDLVGEVRRLHGEEVAAIVRIKYADADNDEVNITGDASLSYALGDWQKRAQRDRSTLAPSWRLFLDVDQDL